MSDIELIKQQLIELSSIDSDDIESDNLEICVEDENGCEGRYTVNITELAASALKEVNRLTEKLEQYKHTPQAYEIMEGNMRKSDAALREADKVINAAQETILLVRHAQPFGDAVNRFYRFLNDYKSGD